MEEENKEKEVVTEVTQVEEKPVENKPAKKISIFIYVGAVILLLVLGCLLYLGLRPKDNGKTPSGNEEKAPKKVVVTSKAVYEFKILDEIENDEKIMLYLRSDGTYRANNSVYIAPTVGTYVEKDGVIEARPIITYGIDGCFEKIDPNDGRSNPVEYKIVGDTLEVQRETKTLVYEKTSEKEKQDDIDFYVVSPEEGKTVDGRTWTKCPVDTFDK